MFLSEIPGYTRAGVRADRLEDYWRDFAFLGLTETIRVPGGRTVEIQQLTLRMFIQLCAIRSPFMVGGKIMPEHVVQVLWRLSPEYGSNQDARKAFVSAMADLPFLSTIRALQRYFDRMLADKPPTSSRRSDSHPDTSFAASVIHALAKTYGWTDDAILDLPMPRIFQYLRKIRRDNDPDMAYFNPLRDRFTKRITDKYLAKKK